jgi:fibro-slime domain-containing protein
MLGRPWVLVLALPLIGCGSRTGTDAYGVMEMDPIPDAGGPDACADDAESHPCETACGKGFQMCTEGTWSGCTAPRPRIPGPTLKLSGTVRDFTKAHPDFENLLGNDRGMVEPIIGTDNKPVYAGNPTTKTTHGKTYFDEWYRDTPGVNESTEYSITLINTPDHPLTYIYDNQAFFPIDNELLGNEGNAHNYHFTYELHAQMRYRGGEHFTIVGDDDIWMFLNGHLAIDLGGVHSAESASVDLDANADKFGLATDGVYPVDVFFAERHTFSSTFHVETTLVEFSLCGE